MAGLNHTIVSLLYVVVSVFSAAFPGSFYVLLWIVMPESGLSERFGID